MTDKDEINILCQKLINAHKDKDADAIVACYAPDALSYSLAPPLANRGLDRSEIAEWLATWNGPIVIKTEDTTLVQQGNIAWSAELSCLVGSKLEGENGEMWFRTTRCFEKHSGSWLIVHEHSSTPFYMDEGFKAAVDLKPGSKVTWNQPSAMPT